MATWIVSLLPHRLSDLHNSLTRCVGESHISVFGTAFFFLTARDTNGSDRPFLVSLQQHASTRVKEAGALFLWAMVCGTRRFIFVAFWAFLVAGKAIGAGTEAGPGQDGDGERCGKRLEDKMVYCRRVDVYSSTSRNEHIKRPIRLSLVG